MTASQVGLGNVNNTSDANKPVSTAQAAAIADAKLAGTNAQSNLTTHINNKSNPHSVSLSSLGVTAKATELNYSSGVTSAIQTQLNGKVSIVKVWENASKTSEFAAQTLTLGLASYSLYILVCRYSAARGGTTSNISPIGYSMRVQGVGGGEGEGGLGAQESIRTFTYSSGNLTIGDALFKTDVKNDALIPIFIYGVK